MEALAGERIGLAKGSVWRTIRTRSPIASTCSDCKAGESVRRVIAQRFARRSVCMNLCDYKIPNKRRIKASIRYHFLLTRIWYGHLAHVRHFGEEHHEFADLRDFAHFAGVDR